jgi:anti-sigma factor RsiW
MNSGISIEGSAAPAAPRIRRPREGADQAFRPWHFFVLSSILLATVGVIITRRSTPEDLILLSLTIGAAGAAAAALYRTLAPLVAPLLLPGPRPVSDRARAALEREKRLVLRSIKELEFDRAMG